LGGFAQALEKVENLFISPFSQLGSTANYLIKPFIFNAFKAFPGFPQPLLLLVISFLLIY